MLRELAVRTVKQVVTTQRRSGFFKICFQTCKLSLFVLEVILYSLILDYLICYYFAYYEEYLNVT